MKTTIFATFIHEFEAWRNGARRLLVQDIPPDAVSWDIGDNDLFKNVRLTGESIPSPGTPGEGTGEGDFGHERPPKSQITLTPTLSRGTGGGGREGDLRVPRSFLKIARSVVHFRAASAGDVLYRVLYRITHGEPDLLELTVDENVHALFRMEKAVRRDEHKMHAFVRFRRVESETGEEYIAWHCPDHPIIPLAAPFFVRRFGAMRWTILTPDASARWDTRSLAFGPGVPRSAAPADDQLEQLWCTYYGSIFNPARIKLRAMRKEMPIRHWATLPETRIIDRLLKEAPARVEEMMKRQASCRTAESAAEFLPTHRELPQLAAAAKSCKGCSLYCHATQVVFGEGSSHARTIFVGEQPGDQEDLAGKPFVGPSGQLLNAVLEEVGIDRSKVYVTNAVKHFKFEQRGKRRIHSKPSAREVAACKPWLQAEIAAIQPALVVCLGSTAAQSLLGPAFRVTRDRGKLIPSGNGYSLIATVHPSSLLRIPDPQGRAQARQQFADDLRIVAQAMAEQK
jgi:probable DNA metabolism protein